MSAKLYTCTQCGALQPVPAFLGQLRHMCYRCSAVHVVHEAGELRCAIPAIAGKRYEIHPVTERGEPSMWYAGETMPPRCGNYQVSDGALIWVSVWYGLHWDAHVPGLPHKWRGVIVDKT